MRDCLKFMVLLVCVGAVLACASPAGSGRTEVDRRGLSPAMDARMALARAEQLQRQGEPAASAVVLEDLLHTASIGGQLSDTGRAMIYAMLADGYHDAHDVPRERAALGNFVIAGSLLSGEDMRTRVRSARATLMAQDIRSKRIGTSPQRPLLIDDAGDVDSILATLACVPLLSSDEDPYPEQLPAHTRLERRQLRCDDGPRTLWFSLDG